MELSSFEIFLTVVEEMNFTRAAQRLYITQQSLSGHIKRLEDAYHVQLFRRRPTLRLTPEGEAMVVFSRQILDSARSMTERFAELSESAAGSLTLGISHQRSNVFFPGIWSSYHTAHKNITIHLRERMTNQLLTELQANQIDLMVGLDIPQVSNLEVQLLAREGLYCILNEILLQEYFPDDWQAMLARYQQEGVDLMELAHPAAGCRTCQQPSARGSGPTVQSKPLRPQHHSRDHRAEPAAASSLLRRRLERAEPVEPL